MPRKPSRWPTICDVYAAACELAMTEKRWKEALGYGLKSIHPDSLAISSDAGCYRLLAEIYSELGQKDKAQEYIQKMNEVMTRYATDHYQSGLSQMEVLYETEKKEARIAQLTSERRLHLWVIGIGCLVLVVTVLLFFYLQLAHRRQKALLAAKVALETEARERHILARDLHDSLGSMLSLLKIKSNSPGTEGNDYQKLLDDIIVEVRRVSHHLMPEELLRSGLESALHDFAVSVPGAHFMATGAISLSKEQELTLYRCAYELVNNALKHAKASHIDIQLTQDEHEVTLTVSDDGKGIQPPPQTPQPTPDTSRKEGGMGLQNIRERIEPYHGVLRIVSNEDDGTEINVTLPL